MRGPLMSASSVLTLLERLLAVAAVTALCLWMAWADPSPQGVAQALERVLRQTVTNPKDANGVTLRIVPASPEETAKGKFRLVEISAKPAKVKGVFLREFYGRAVEPVVDVQALLREGELKTVSTKESVMEGVMDAEALEQIFAEGKSTRPMKIKVRITDDGRLQLQGILTLLRINNPFEAICRAEPGKDGLYVRIDELRINGVPAPAFLRRQLEERVNPVVKRDALPFHPEIRSVRIYQRLIYVNRLPPMRETGHGARVTGMVSKQPSGGFSPTKLALRPVSHVLCPAKGGHRKG